MRLIDALKEFCDPRIAHNEEAIRAFNSFIKNLPQRILDVDIDVSKTGKVGFSDGEKLYKMGFVAESAAVFVEFYENKNSGQPSMMMSSIKNDEALIIRGTHNTKTFYLGFFVKNGVVEKVQKTE